MMPTLRDWSVLDHVLNLVCEDRPDRKLLLALHEGRLIGEPAAGTMALALATGKDRQRIHATLAAMGASHYQCGIGVTIDGVDGWFGGNLANHAAAARAVEEGDAGKVAMPWSRFFGFSRSQLSRRKTGAGRRHGRPGGSRSLRKK